MKLNIRRRSLSSRAFLFLILLGLCFISVVTYTATFADGWHGWGNGGFPWSNMQGQGQGQSCGATSGSNQSCNPFANGLQTCTSTGSQGTSTQSQGSGTPTNGWQGWGGQRQSNAAGGTPTNNWRAWQNCSGTPGQNNGTPISSPPACNTTTNPITGAQTPVSTDIPQIQTPVSTDIPQIQTPVLPVNPCPSPTSVLPPSSTPTVVPPGGPLTPVPTVVSSPVSTPVSGGTPQSQAAQAVFAQINQERASQGAPAMQWSDQLQQSAHDHNLAMAQANQLSHQLPGEPDFGTRITNVGIHWTSAAENISPVSLPSGTETLADMATQTNQGLFDEPSNGNYAVSGHRDNILSGNTLVGVDVLIDTQNNTGWLTEDFAKPSSSGQ